jgi:hypothetical protein
MNRSEIMKLLAFFLLHIHHKLDNKRYSSKGSERFHLLLQCLHFADNKSYDGGHGVEAICHEPEGSTFYS